MKLKVLCILIVTLMLVSCSTENTQASNNLEEQTPLPTIEPTATATPHPTATATAEPTQTPFVYPATPYHPDMENTGNTNGNLMNRGFGFYDVYRDEYFVFSVVNKILRSRWETEGTISNLEAIVSKYDYEIERIEKHLDNPDIPITPELFLSYINAYDDFLYYIDSEDRYAYRVNYLTAEIDSVLEFEVASLMIANDIMYYTMPHGKNYTIYTCDLEGENKELLTTASAPNLNYYDNCVYYYLNDSVYKISLNDYNISVVAQDVTERFMLYEGKVYATDKGNRLMCEGVVIMENCSEYFNISNDIIFYAALQPEVNPEYNLGWPHYMDMNTGEVNFVEREIFMDDMFCILADDLISISSQYSTHESVEIVSDK